MKNNISVLALAAGVALCMTSCSKSVQSDLECPSGEPNSAVTPKTEAVDFGIAGFATLNGGTTGGQGGSTVTATTFAELKSYLESSTTYIVRVDRRIYNGTKGGRINVNSNKTLS